MMLQDNMNPARTHPPFHPVMPPPPHERRGSLRVAFSEDDWRVLCAVFGDGDSAAAAASIILNSPPEIQILAVQMISMIQKEVSE